MSFLSRLIGKRRDDREPVRALWHRVVALARAPEWYAQCGIADTVAGRFDTITLVLGTVLLRMERDPALAQGAVWLTELFVEDMDGQLREAGIGDLVVGKHVGRLMGVLGGRLGALRDALPQGEAALAVVIARNVTMNEGADALHAARRTLDFAARLDAMPDAALLAGDLA